MWRKYSCKHKDQGFLCVAFAVARPFLSKTAPFSKRTNFYGFGVQSEFLDFSTHTHTFENLLDINHDWVGEGGAGESVR